MRNPLSFLLAAPIRFYRAFLSPLLPRRCRYYPSCSAYAIDALGVHGAAKGFLLGTWRVLRCNPWSRGGVDHVPEKGQWKAPPWVAPDDWVGHEIEYQPGFFERACARFRDLPDEGSKVVEVPSHPRSLRGSADGDRPESKFKES